MTGRDIETTLRLNGRTHHVMGRITGADAAPVTALLGGISADRLAADEPGVKGWWGSLAGPDQALDPARRRFLTLDYLPGGEDESGWAPSTRDQGGALLAIAEAAGVRRFDIVSASYGGMVALSLAAAAPEPLTRIAVIGAAHRTHPMTAARRAIQRDMVRLGLKTGETREAMIVARALAMTTYRTAAEFGARFTAPPPDSADAAGVSAYLRSRGEAYADVMPPARFLALSESMDAHAVDPAAVRLPVRLIAIAEDEIAPLSDMQALRDALPDCEWREFSSAYGHDAFLKAPEEIAAALAGVLEEPA